MINIWNRKEIFVGFSVKKFNEILDLLSRNKIQYKYKIINRTHPKLEGMDTNWEDMKYSGVYYIYVHKKDYESARAVLQSSNILNRI
ncbi:MAG: hypothetical protein GX272_10750 [Epulopiscium sp.]|nr:hypothetical protein [Candidatus Epulonipiscium sp.]